MKKTYIKPDMDIKNMAIAAILADSITIGGDLTTGEHEGRSKDGSNLWEDED